jgi:6,7-dimethyl-8-ribityllumazine synthase
VAQNTGKKNPFKAPANDSAKMPGKPKTKSEIKTAAVEISQVDAPMSAKGMIVGIVTARFNQDVTELLGQGAMDQLLKMGCREKDIISVTVPGAFEIPLAAKHLLKAGVDAVVACGAVIRGDTTHYDYVCAAVERGCSELQLEFSKPVAFSVLTTENLTQALDRAGGKHGNKGAEGAEVAVEMVLLAKKIKKMV